MLKLLLVLCEVDGTAVLRTRAFSLLSYVHRMWVADVIVKRTLEMLVVLENMVKVCQVLILHEAW